MSPGRYRGEQGSQERVPYLSSPFGFRVSLSYQVDTHVYSHRWACS